jgi:hypothetical protein
MKRILNKPLPGSLLEYLILALTWSGLIVLLFRYRAFYPEILEISALRIAGAVLSVGAGVLHPLLLYRLNGRFLQPYVSLAQLRLLHLTLHLILLTNTTAIILLNVEALNTFAYWQPFSVYTVVCLPWELYYATISRRNPFNTPPQHAIII